MKESKGILLIATNHSNYGGMAYNLALTLKAVEPEIEIALVHDQEAVKFFTDEHKNIFSHLIETRNGGLHLKFDIVNLSPFDKTMYLDVDILWLPMRKPSEALAILDSTPFTMQNEGFVDLDTQEDNTSKVYVYWGDMTQIKEAYQLKGRFYQFRSEMILFEKTKEVKAMFTNARKLAKKPKTDVFQFAGTTPDEHFFNIAANMAGIQPHLSNWQPGYWTPRQGGIIPNQRSINQRFYFMSFGGNHVRKELKAFYKELLDVACNKLGLLSPFGLQSKRMYLTERHKY